MVRVLVACEESQAVTKAFRAKSHEAYSCDLQPCSGGRPEWHMQNDIMTVLDDNKSWDLIIMHPDCTALALSGNRWYGSGMPMHQKRLDAVKWTVELWQKAKEKSSRVCLENPMSVIFQYLNAHVQYIQPYQFGHGEQKKTGLALFGLPELKSTNEVSGRDQRVWKMPPSPERKKMRSKTYKGIAKAMAEQWALKE